MATLKRFSGKFQKNTLKSKSLFVVIHPKLILGPTCYIFIDFWIYLHELPDHIPAHNMIKDGLKPCVLHQTELDPVPMPGEDGAGLQGGHRHLEELVRGDTEPLRRVEELVVID